MIALVSLLIGFWAVPALATGPDNSESAPAEQATWDKMHEACQEGDWDEMAKAAEEVHGNDINSMPCHDESSTSQDEKSQSQSHHGDMDNDMHGNMMGGHMSDGMMSGHMGNGGSMMR